MTQSRVMPRRSVLLATVSALAITIAVERGPEAADIFAPAAAPVATAPADAGEMWVAIEGNFNWYEGDELRDNFYSQVLVGETGWSGALEIGMRPAGSQIDFVGRFRYGRGEENTSDSDLYYIPYSYYSSNSTASSKETHIIADFEVGRNIGIGLGQTRVHAGLRFAHFDSERRDSGTSGSNYFYYSYSGNMNSTFTGIGPRIGVNTDIPLSNNLMVEVDVAGALLFGRRETTSNFNDYGYYGAGAYSSTQSKSVLVPNLEASAGITYLFGENASATIGYRVDAYWNVVEKAGFGTTNDGDRIMHGPFARVKIKLGGN